MTIYAQIENLLENNEDARERRFRDQYLIDLILEKHGKSGSMFVDVHFLKDFAKDFESYSREWRHVTRTREDLRGEDYGDKEVLEQGKILRLGYEVGYTEDLKLSKRI